VPEEVIDQAGPPDERQHKNPIERKAMDTPKKDAARKRWTRKDDELGLVYVFEDNKTWMEWYAGEDYLLHTTVDGRERAFDVHGAGIVNTKDVSVFTIACDILDDLATGWRPINW
jgi:hypothetical protein